MMRSCISGGPFVVALLKLALDLFHRIEPDTDDMRIEVPPKGKF